MYWQLSWSRLSHFEIGFLVAPACLKHPIAEDNPCTNCWYYSVHYHSVWFLERWSQLCSYDQLASKLLCSSGWPQTPYSSFPISWKLKLRAEVVCLDWNNFIYLCCSQENIYKVIEIVCYMRRPCFFFRPKSVCFVLQKSLWALCRLLGSLSILLTLYPVFTFSPAIFLCCSAAPWNKCFPSTRFLSNQQTSLTTQRFLDQFIVLSGHCGKKKESSDLFKRYNHLIN